jgi:hypothetical protein
MSEIEGMTYDPTGIQVRRIADGGRLGETSMSRAPGKRRVRPVPEIDKKPPRHPEHDKRCRLWAWLQASYDGGSEYKSAKDPDGKEVLVGHESESPKSLERRKRCTPYKNFCRPVVEKIVAYVFGNSPQRDTQEQFVEWGEDVDMAGTELEDFIEDSMRQSRILGSWFVLVDTTKPSPKMTVAQAKQAGSKMFLQHVHPGRVLDWSDDDSWYLCLHDEVDGQFIRLWDQTNVQTWSLDDKGKVKADLGIIPHGWPLCPLHRVRGKSLIHDVALLNQSYYNVDSILREELARQTFTQYMLLGVSADDVSDSTGSMMGPRRLLCVNKPAQDMKLERLGADSSQAESLRATMEQDRKEIYNLVGLRPPDVETGPESGRALRIRQADTYALCERLSDDACQAEAWVTEMFKVAYGIEVEEPRYPEDFQEEVLQDQLKMALDMVGSEAFPPSVKGRVSADFVAHKLSNLEEEERDEMVKETLSYWEEKAKEIEESKAMAKQAMLDPEAAKEQAEHPTLNPAQAKQVADDHAKLGK